MEENGEGSMDGYKIFSIVAGLIYMVVLGVSFNFRETAKAAFVDVVIALVIGGAWFFLKKFFNVEYETEARVWAVVFVIALGIFVILIMQIFSSQGRSVF